MKHIRRFLPLILLLTLSLVAWKLDLYRSFNMETLRLYHTDLHMYVAEHTLMAGLIFFALYCLSVSISLPIATFLTVLAGVLFGQGVGTFLAVTAATAGATILFLTTRFASEELISERGGRFTQSMQRGFQENAFSYLLTLRLIPLFPFVVVNLAAALFGVPIRTFVISTLIGIIPGSFVYVSTGVALGAVINQPNVSLSLILEPRILAALIGLGCLALLPIFYKRWKRRHPE